MAIRSPCSAIDLGAPLGVLDGGGADVDPAAAGRQRRGQRLVVADAAAHLDVDVERADDLGLQRAVAAAAERRVEVDEVQPLGAGVLPAPRGGDRVAVASCSEPATPWASWTARPSVMSTAGSSWR